MRQQARKAQEEFAPLDENDIYGTAIDPFVRTRQKRITYDKEATQWNNYEELGNVKAVFEADFSFRTKEHFKSLPNTILSKMRDILVKRNVHIERRPGLGMSTALTQYI